MNKKDLLAEEKRLQDAIHAARSKFYAEREKLAPLEKELFRLKDELTKVQQDLIVELRSANASR